MHALGLIVAALAIAASAQATRYLEKVFDSSTLSPDITYSQAPSILTGVDMILKMDIYTPAGDTLPKRPLILIGHGGSFVSGGRKDAEPVRFATAFAQRGYVTASFDYRLGLDQVNRAGFVRSIYRAVQDAAAAVRYMREQSDIWGIDTSLIFLGGFSAGAILSLHHAHWDPAEIPPEVDTSSLGAVDRGRTEPRVSSRVGAVINIAGALGDTSWIDIGGTPIVNAHGTNDLVVPYGFGGVFGIQSLPVYGSSIIHRSALERNVKSALLSLEGQGHSIDINSPTADSIITFVAAFLFEIVTSGESPVKNKRLNVPARRSDAVVLMIPSLSAGSSLQTGAVYFDLQGNRISQGRRIRGLVLKRSSDQSAISDSR